MAQSFNRCHHITLRFRKSSFVTPKPHLKMICARCDGLDAQGGVLYLNMHLNYLSDDMQHFSLCTHLPAQTKELVDSIIKRRMHKLELGMSELTGPVTVKLNNLSVMELNTIRPFFQIALQRFHEFAQVVCSRGGALNPTGLLPYKCFTFPHLLQLETSLETRTGTYGSSTLGSTPATEQTPARRLRR